jgi:hypothetical protein
LAPDRARTPDISARHPKYPELNALFSNKKSKYKDYAVRKSSMKNTRRSINNKNKGKIFSLNPNMFCGFCSIERKSIFTLYLTNLSFIVKLFF